jgi:aspartate/methionine/tyrosine aminotransferase
VGYVTCDRSLAPNVAKAHQNLTFTTAPNLQRGVAVGLMKDDGYFAGISAALQAKRDLLAAGLSGLGFCVLPTQGSYFITADFRPLGFAGDDAAFCRALTEEAGVAAIPVTAFYADPAAAPNHYARFAFCKDEAVLRAALGRTRAWIDARRGRVLTAAAG